MGALPFAALLLAAVSFQQSPADDPAKVVQQALAAVEGDSVQAAERRWVRALSRDSANRAAALGLATLALYTYRDSIAQSLFETAMAPGADDRVTGYSALGSARLAALRGKWLRADSVLERAIAVGSAWRDSSLLAESLVLRGWVKLPVLDMDKGFEALAQADALTPPNDHRLQAFSRCVRSEALEARFDPNAALQTAEEGVALAKRSGDARTLALCEFRRGFSLGSLFSVDSSFAAYDRSIAAYRVARDRAGLANALRHRGDQHRLFGQLGYALRDAREAATEGEASGMWTVAAWAHATQAQIAFSVGDLREAAAHASRVRPLFERGEDPYGRVMGPSLEAQLALRQDDIDAARTHHEAAAREASAIGWINGEAGARQSLVWVAVLKHDSAEAYAAIDAARSMLERRRVRGHEDAMSFLDGMLAFHYRPASEAERIFRRRLAGNQSRGARRYVDRVRLSEILLRTGRLDEAERELIAAAEEFDAWRATLRDRQLQLLAFQAVPDRADPDLGFATVVSALARDGRLASAFDLIERTRARELTDRLAQAAALDTTGARHVKPGGARLTLNDLQRSLPDDSTAVLEYVTGRGDPTTLLVITRREARTYVLEPQDSLTQPIARFGALIESGEDPRPLGQRLGASLFTPLLAELDPAIKRLIVVADGPIHRLPFDALVLPDGRFLVEQFAVTSTPAASIAAQLWSRRANPPPAGLAVLADPRFANETESRGSDADVFRSAFVDKRGLPRLEGSSREARTVARYAENATVRRRQDASETWLKSASLKEYGIVHFATHALVDDASVTRSALALAPEGSEDGFVGPADLANLDLAAQLVVLSACRTAGGMIVRGEGIQGLTAPLLVAGAQAVAATWWPIGDVATVRFVNDFYHAMAEGQPASDALRSAKLAALGRGAPAREWAAFMLVGDPLARPSLHIAASSRPGAVYIGVAIAIVLIAYALVSRQRRV